MIAEFSLKGDRLAVTRPGEVGVGTLTEIDWLPVGDWHLVGWATPDLVALRRRGELGLLDTGRRMLASTHPVVGRTLRFNGEEALVAVVRNGRPVLCVHRPSTGTYQVLDATEGVTSAAAWNDNTIVLTKDRKVVLVRYDDTASEQVTAIEAVSATGDGTLVALTAEGEVPGVLDLNSNDVRWFAPGSSGVAVSPSGLLLTMSWTDHRYRYQVLNRDGEVVGTPVPDHGIATELTFTADERHLLGRHQSPAASPVLARWDIHSGQMQELPGQRRKQVAVRWQHSPHSPEWLYEPETGGHGGTVLHLHGGPRSQLRQIHEPMIAALVEAGWTVIGMNYPGSSGYGDEFRDVVVGDWGGADVAAVTERLHELRRDHPVCLYGQSYGAYLALLAAAAELVDAVAVWAPVTDLPQLLESATGLHRQWLRTELAGLAGDQRELEARSPINRPFTAHHLLIGHSKGDERVPVEQSRRFVERQGADRYLEQPGNGHEPADMDTWSSAVVEHFREVLA
ncbi:alpha/beta fold hydrolase [Lentzea sp. NPDC051838]|uniref:alpha/beta hydrolase family protein n=1 Tax=Lentzea sp. NPDC051838 TaxID=3154849 RepID=UPI003419BCEC